jgi:hypothetical protein
MMPPAGRAPTDPLAYCLERTRRKEIAAMSVDDIAAEYTDQIRNGVGESLCAQARDHR